MSTNPIKHKQAVTDVTIVQSALSSLRRLADWKQGGVVLTRAQAEEGRDVLREAAELMPRALINMGTRLATSEAQGAKSQRNKRAKQDNPV